MQFVHRSYRNAKKGNYCYFSWSLFCLILKRKTDLNKFTGWNNHCWRGNPAFMFSCVFMFSWAFMFSWVFKFRCSPKHPSKVSTLFKLNYYILDYFWFIYKMLYITSKYWCDVFEIWSLYDWLLIKWLTWLFYCTCVDEFCVHCTFF